MSALSKAGPRPFASEGRPPAFFQSALNAAPSQQSQLEVSFPTSVQRKHSSSFRYAE